MSNKTQHTPTYVVKYTAIGNPIPDEFNPAYNAGYETTEHCELIQATEDEIMARFAGTDTEKLQIIGPLTGSSSDLLRERDELKKKVEQYFKGFADEAQKVAFLQIDNMELKEFLNVKDEVIKKELALNSELLKMLKKAIGELEDAKYTYDKPSKTMKDSYELIAKCEGRAKA